MIKLNVTYDFIYRDGWLKRAILELISDELDTVNLFKKNKFTVGAISTDGNYYDNTKDYLSWNKGETSRVVIMSDKNNYTGIATIVTDVKTKVTAFITNWKTSNQYSTKPANESITL
jgi:hypothetical protein